MLFVKKLTPMNMILSNCGDQISPFNVHDFILKRITLIIVTLKKVTVTERKVNNEKENKGDAIT